MDSDDAAVTPAATLLEVVSDLEPPLQLALSSMIVDGLPDGAYEVLLDFALMVPIDTEGVRRIGDLPRGVSHAGWERWRCLRRRLVDRPSVEDQILEVHHAGIVGSLDAALLETQGRPRRWMVKTHAGSDDERRAWLARLPSSLQ